MYYRRDNLTCLPKFSDGDVIEECNLAQPAMNTPAGAGAKRLVFRRCNLVNCVVPDDATLEDCVNFQVPPVVPKALTPQDIAEREEEDVLVEGIIQSFDGQRDAAISAALNELYASRKAKPLTGKGR